MREETEACLEGAPPSSSDSVNLSWVPEPVFIGAKGQIVAEGLTVVQEHAIGLLRATLARSGPFVVVFNLFAVDVWHIAEALSLPCVALSPYAMPSSPPAGFFEWLRRDWAPLADELDCAEAGAPSAAPRRMTKLDVQRWAFSLFNVERWKTLRSHLRLAPLPGFKQGKGDSWEFNALPLSTPLLFLFSPSVLLDGGVGCETLLDPAHCIGFAQRSQGLLVASTPVLTPLAADPSSEAAHASVECPTPKIILVSFGCLGPGGFFDIEAADERGNASVELDVESLRLILGAISDGGSLEPVGAASARQPHVVGVLVGCGWRGFSLACGESDAGAAKAGLGDGGDTLASVWPAFGMWLETAASAKRGDGRMPFFVHDGSVDFERILPHVNAFVHHGGSGSFAAALAWGVPQVIIPAMMDQFYWAASAARLGVSPSESHHLTLHSLLQDDDGAGAAAAAAARERLKRAVHAAICDEALASRARDMAAGVRAERNSASVALEGAILRAEASFLSGF